MDVRRLSPPRRGVLARLAPVLLVALTLGPAARAPARELGRPFRLLGQPAWSVAMHVHGSLSEGIGSMAWHADKARACGVDVIWWTDHDWRMESWHHTQGYDFEAAFYNGTQLWVEEPDAPYLFEDRYWALEAGGTLRVDFGVVDTLAHEGSRCLRFQGEDLLRSTTWQSASLAQTGSRKQSRYSLASRVTLHFAVLPESLDPVNGKFVFGVELSEHPEGPVTLRYVAGSLDGEGPETIPLPLVPGVWNEVEIDVTGEVLSRFTTGGVDTLRGEDNSLYLVHLGLEARNGHLPRIFFDDYRIEIDTTLTGADMVAKQHDMIDYYAGIYPEVTQFVGTEISRFKAQPHLNAYAPDLQLVDYGSHGWEDSLTYAVEQVHAQGGAVSFNHMFGTQVYGDTTDAQWRIDDWRQKLIGARGYGCDLLEVGYRWRGGLTLEHHLRVWDALSANGLFLTGNGVNDSHGTDLFEGWAPREPVEGRENNFATWFFGDALTAEELIHAMKAGRAFFGDPYAFGGTVDLASTDGFPMGRVVFTDQDSHDVIVEATGVAPDIQVRLLQMEIRLDTSGYLEPNVLRDQILDGSVIGGVFADTISVDTRTSSFVRVEVRGVSGSELAFSNPLHFVRSLPAAGIAPERAAARLDGLRLVRAEDVTLTGMEFTSPVHLTLTGDEDPPGLGVLEIDCGWLGDPTAVIGAAVWNAQNGILTLQGFGGSGSTVHVFWSALGVPLTSVHELALAPGRPNPFGSGIVTEFALPRADHVRLEVFDIRGRRVRVLRDEPMLRGVHRVEWNGHDDRGRPVAAGAYFLRLQADGRSLTTKAIKVD